MSLERCWKLIFIDFAVVWSILRMISFSKFIDCIELRWDLKIEIKKIEGRRGEKERRIEKI